MLMKLKRDALAAWGSAGPYARPRRGTPSQPAPLVGDYRRSERRAPAPSRNYSVRSTINLFRMSARRRPGQSAMSGPNEPPDSARVASTLPSVGRAKHGRRQQSPRTNAAPTTSSSPARLLSPYVLHRTSLTADLADAAGAHSGTARGDVQRAEPVHQIRILHCPALPATMRSVALCGTRLPE